MSWIIASQQNNLFSPHLQIPDYNIQGFAITLSANYPADRESASKLVRDETSGLTYIKKRKSAGQHDQYRVDIEYACRGFYQRHFGSGRPAHF